MEATKFTAENVRVGQVIALEDDNESPGEIVEIFAIESDEIGPFLNLGDDRFMRLPIWGWAQL
jgi:hypothetical protein